MEPKTYNSTKNPVITKNFDVSTGHIKRFDNLRLRRAKNDVTSPLIVYSYREGCFVYVPTDEGKFDESEVPAIQAYGFSDALVNLLREAARLECKYLQLDSDAMNYENFPTFDW